MPAWSIFLNTIYYPLVKYRIHISVIFFFLLVNVYSLIAKQPVNWPVVLAFSLWHFALYIFDRAYDFKLDLVNQPQEAIKPQERSFFIWLSIILCLAPVPILAISKNNILPYLPFIPVTFLYTFPLYKNIRSKNILFFKNLYSALLIWTLPLCIVLVYYSNHNFNFFKAYQTNFISLLIYVMIGEAFWDIRDVDGDKAQHVNTIPVTFGLTFTRVYLLVLISADYFFISHKFTLASSLYIVLILWLNQKSARWIFHLPPLLALFQFIQTLF